VVEFKGRFAENLSAFWPAFFRNFTGFPFHFFLFVGLASNKFAKATATHTSTHTHTHWSFLLLLETESAFLFSCCTSRMQNSTVARKSRFKSGERLKKQVHNYVAPQNPL